jgi:hypothetical protein
MESARTDVIIGSGAFPFERSPLSPQSIWPLKRITVGHNDRVGVADSFVLGRKNLYFE